MITFTTCSANPIANDLVNAHLLTRDNQVIQGRISIENGVITAQANSHSNFALCLMYDAGKSGRLMLQTSILTQRDKPYMLALELARHRIKSFLDLSENWSLFHLSDDNPAVQKWEESRLIFTKSLVCINEEERGLLARRALELSIDASERLTMAHAQILLHRRYATKAASSSTLGVSVSPSRFDEPLRKIIHSNSEIVTLQIRWSDIEKEEGVFDWESLDRWVRWARDHKKHIIAGPLLDFTKESSIPPWVRLHEHDYTQFRDKCYDYIEKVVQRYGAAISFWNIISGINLNRHVRMSLGNMVDLIRTARLLVKQGRKDARVMVELAEPFSEFVASMPESSNAKVFLARLAQEGVPLDAIGVQLLVGGSKGRSTRDLMQMSAKLDEFLHADYPIIISALGAPSKVIHERNGWWKKPWTEISQEAWATRMITIGLSKPFVDSVIWTDLFDYKKMDLPTAGFVSINGKPKSVMSRMFSMNKRLKKPLGHLELPKRKDANKEEL